MDNFKKEKNKIYTHTSNFMAKSCSLIFLLFILFNFSTIAQLGTRVKNMLKKLVISYYSPKATLPIF